MEQNANPIDNSVLEALRPRDRRFDVSVEGELVLSVQPNGVKTWTWVYDEATGSQRKTLGIYPDMSIDEARNTLAAERAAQSRAAAQGPEFVIRDGRIEAVSPSTSQIPVIAAVAVAMVTVAVLAWLFLKGDADSNQKNGSAQLQMDRSVNKGNDGPDPFKPIAEVAGPDAIQLPQTPAMGAEDSAATSEQREFSQDLQNESIAQVDPVPAESVPAESVAAGSVPADPLPVPVPADNSPGVDKQSVTQPLTVDLIAPPALRPEVLPQQTPSPPSVPESELPSEAVVASPATETDGGLTNGNGLIVDSRVARGNLTTAIEQREPLDDLGSTILSNGAAEQQYYFFTELRELAGQRVRHRWLYNDRVVAEIPFNVGEAWRWRVYSSKTFIPSMTGRWQAQVVLDDDTVIYNLPFTFVE